MPRIGFGVQGEIYKLPVYVVCTECKLRYEVKYKILRNVKDAICPNCGNPLEHKEEIEL